jgi:putrescine aminotransferase
MNRADLVRIYERHYNPPLSLLFDLAHCPIEAHAKGSKVYDDQGNAYLDFAAGYGVFSVGHANEQVQAAVLRQLEKLTYCPALALNEAYATLLEALADVLPSDLSRVFLAGSGSEAIEIALRLALNARPGRRRLVAVHHGFHGKTVGALGITGQDYLRTPFEPVWEDVRFVEYGDARAIADAVGDGAAAVIVEPVLGGGFVTVPPTGYIAELRTVCDRTNTVFIVDEVQTGFGRTGKMFAFEHDGVVPDIVILTKGMTGGHTPMAAAVARDELVRACAGQLDCDPFIFSTDVERCPITCAAAAAAIRFTIDAALPSRAHARGEHLQRGLRRVAARYPHLALDVPGKGLMTGVKLRNNMLEIAVWIQMLKRRVITGLSTNPMTPTPVMRFFPPLIVEEGEIDVAVDALDDSLKELARVPGLLLDLANQAAKVQYHLPRPILRGVARMFSGPARS